MSLQRLLVLSLKLSMTKLPLRELLMNPNDTTHIAATTQNAVHTLSERMRAMDGDDQLDNDEVFDDVGDE